MVPFFQVLSLVWHLVAVRYCAVEAAEWQSAVSSRRNRPIMRGDEEQRLEATATKNHVARTEESYRRKNGGDLGGLARISEEFEHYKTATRPPSGGVENGVWDPTKMNARCLCQPPHARPCDGNVSLARLGRHEEKWPQKTRKDTKKKG